MFCLVWWNISDVPLYEALDFLLVPRGRRNGRDTNNEEYLDTYTMY